MKITVVTKDKNSLVLEDAEAQLDQERGILTVVSGVMSVVFLTENVSYIVQEAAPVVPEFITPADE